MTDPVAIPDPVSHVGNADEVRATLEQMRRQAEGEIARLNRKLAERELAMDTSVSSATERQAMQQDLVTLRHSLGDKERTLDRITQECRRLEDDLEDRHIEVDGLKQEVQRKENSLKAARDEVARLKRQLAENQEQLRDGSAALSDSRKSSQGLSPFPPLRPDTPGGPAPQMISFSAGLISGLVVIALIAAAFWGQREWHRIHPRAPTPAPSTVEVAATTEPVTESLPAVAPVVAPVPAAPRLGRLQDGSQGPIMVALSGGRFRMGQNTLGDGDNGPEHEVQLAPFLIGVYEITFQQYDRFARATGRRLPDDFGWGRADRPVVGVSWFDAQAYADWLTRQTGKRYRLPSEAEWEYAAQGGTRTSYPWGFGMEPERAVCFDCGSRWDNRSTAPIGSFAPNAFGLYDMAGNALEWVADCYMQGYDGAPTDGRVRVGGGCTNRVARGGAYNKPAPSLKTHARARFGPESRLNNLGFRVARDP